MKILNLEDLLTSLARKGTAAAPPRPSRLAGSAKGRPGFPCRRCVESNVELIGRFVHLEKRFSPIPIDCFLSPKFEIS